MFVIFVRDSGGDGGMLGGFSSLVGGLEGGFSSLNDMGGLGTGLARGSAMGLNEISSSSSSTKYGCFYVFLYI